MRGNLVKKGLVLGMICLFLGASMVSGISNINSKNFNKTEEIDNSLSVKNNETLNSVIVFSDDFNDNSKDYSKWTELYDEGEWFERNQRCEFQLYELDGTTYSEGIESSSFSVSMGHTKSVFVSADMFTDIFHSPGQGVGQIHMSVTDGTDSITASYYRSPNELSFRDSKGGYTVLNDNQGEGSWNIEIEIRRDEYRVTMNSITSDWIGYKVFSSSANPSLKIQLFMHLAGSYPDKYWVAGFDNVIVEDEGQHPVVDYSYDCEGYTVDFDASTLTYDPDGGEIAMYIWDFTNDGYDDAGGPTASCTYESDGTFECELWVMDDDGEEWWVIHDITVPCDDPPPVACYTYNVNGCTVSFDASCSTGDIVSYNWDFGDGVSTTGKTVTHTYPGSGTYSCELRVEDNNGFTDTETKDISVSCETDKPDLVVSYIKPYYGFDPGETLHFLGGIDNTGLGDAIGDFEVCVYLDDEYIGSKTIHGLVAGGHDFIQHLISWPNDKNSHTVKMYVDCNEKITEKNENNNDLSESFRAMPDLTIPDSGFYTNPSNPKRGGKITIHASVYNIGYSDIESDNPQRYSFVTGFYIDGESVGNCGTFSLKAGHYDDVYIETTWPNDFKSHVIKVFADIEVFNEDTGKIEDLVEESNELNNGNSMSKSKAMNTPLIRFLENHPYLFPLLRQLLRL